jgi:acyl-coenzyme A thioesterase PaaI-like protein
VLKRGRRFGYAEADVVDADGALLARAAATFSVMPEREPSTTG